MAFHAHENRNFPLGKFESMLKTNKVYFFDSEDFQEIIHYYLDTGRLALAKKAIKIGLEQHPASVPLKLLHTEVLIFEDKLEIAEKMLDKLSSIETFNEEIFIQKANIYSKKNQHHEAVSLLKQALALAEDPVELYSLIGMEYLFLEDYGSAKGYFIKCIHEDIEDYASLYNAVYCFDFLEDHDGAITFLNGYLDKNPYCEVAWHQLGRQFFTKEMYKEALSSLDFAIYSDDTFVGAYLEKGKVLEQLDRYEEAIENYEITFGLDAPSSFACLRVGKCYEKLGDLKLAKEYYYKTVREDPLLDKGWITITDLYYKEGNYQKALHYITKAIDIDSENTLYWKRSAKINKKLHLYKDAASACKKLVELGSYELENWVCWADMLKKTGEYHSALTILLQGLECYPETPDLEYRIAGICYLHLEALKGDFYLKNALKHNYEKHAIFKELFPTVFSNTSVKNIITDFKKASM